MMKLRDGSAGGLVCTSDLLGQRDEELGLFESHGWGCSLCYGVCMSDIPGPWGSLLGGSCLVHGYLHGHLHFCWI